MGLPRYLRRLLGDNDEPDPAERRAKEVIEQMRQGPVYSPDSALADASGLITREPQPTQPLAKYSTPEPAAAAAPAGPRVTYGPEGQPRGVEGDGDELAKQEAYLRALEAYKPENHNSRLKSIGLGAVRALTRGQSPIFGALESAIDPTVDERFANDREIARVGRSVKGQYVQHQAAADLDYRKAQAEKARDPEYMETAEGPVGVRGNVATPIYDPEGQRIKPKPSSRADKFEIRHDEQTGRAEKWRLGEGGEPDTKVEGWSDASKNMVMRNGLWVPQGTALTAEATAENRDYGRQRDVTEDQRRERERNEDQSLRSQEKFQDKLKDAGRLTGQLDGARERWKAADAKVSQLQQRLAAETDQEKRAAMQERIDDWEFERTKAQDEAAKAAVELNTAHGDIFEAGVAETDEKGAPSRGLAYYKRKPFNVKSWRTKYPKATKQQEERAIQNAIDAQMEIVK